MIRRIRVGPIETRLRGTDRKPEALIDNDEDGRMDESIVWADDIPAAMVLSWWIAGSSLQPLTHLLLILMEIIN